MNGAGSSDDDPGCASWCSRLTYSACSIRTTDKLTHAAWLIIYGLCVVGVFAGWWWPAMSWMRGLIFVISLGSVVFHIVRASLTRFLPPVRLIFGLNVVVLAAASLASHQISKQASAAVVASVPLLSYYLYFGWRLALAPPRPGEAMRPEMKLKECHWVSRAVVYLVLSVEFVQFNALSFNPALGLWKDVHQLCEYLSYSLLIFRYGSDDGGSVSFTFERQIWVFCSLAIGWVLFALVALCISSPPRSALEARRAATGDDVDDPFSRIGHNHSRGLVIGVSDSRLGGGAGLYDGAELKGGGGEYTMNSPLRSVWDFILLSAWKMAWGWFQLLKIGKSESARLCWGAKACKLRAIGNISLIPVAGMLWGCAFFLSLLLLFLIVGYLILGAAVCIAFASIALLHFPILMNMLSVLNCQYDASGMSGTMDRMPEQPCWEGKHWFFAVVSVVTIGVLYPVMIHFERKRQSAAEISYHVRFTSFMVIGKLALSASSALLLNTVPPAAYLLLVFVMLVAFLHVNNQREQDNQPACCNVRTVRLLRSMLLTCALWSVTTTLASTVLQLPDWCLATALGILWLVTFVFFTLIINFPQHEPAYQSEAPELVAISTVSGGTPKRLYPARGGGGNPNGVGGNLNGCGVLTSPTTGGNARSTSPSRRPGPHESGADSVTASHHYPTQDHPYAQHAPNPYPGQSGRPLRDEMAERPSTFSPHAAPSGKRGGAGKGERSGSDRTDAAGFRTVYLPAQVSQRPQVEFYDFDDGFDTPAGGAHGSHKGEGVGTAAESGSLHPWDVEPPPDDLIAIVLATAPPLSCGGHAPLSAGAGGGHLLGGGMSGCDGELSAGDVIVGVNGEMGLSAREVERRLDEQHGLLELTVRRAALRNGGSKRSRASSHLGAYPERFVAQCMMLYPQDAALQRAGCERLARAVREASKRSTLATLTEELRKACVLPVVLNAMEVHVKSAPVLIVASRFLECVANVDGNLRANLVAAGLLPALCAGLAEHREGAYAVHALCDLCAEVCSARGAPTGSRRAMCEAVAVTGALRAALGAFRAHVTHMGVVAAVCKMLLAYQEEFAAEQSLPSALTEALCHANTASALENAQQSFSDNPVIQLGAEWAVGVARGRTRHRERVAGGGAEREAGRRRAAGNTPLRAERGVLQPVRQCQIEEMESPAGVTSSSPCRMRKKAATPSAAASTAAERC